MRLTKVSLLTLLTLLLTTWLTANATVKVTNLHLQKNSQFTEFTVDCDGPCEFTHQIVEAAANKPFRIVVDVKDAINALPQSAFSKFPSSSIKQIRSSQFSTSPDKIVRVVLDVAGSLTYKVKSNGNSFSLMINTPADKDFSTWSAVSGSPSTTMATTPSGSTPEPTTKQSAKVETPASNTSSGVTSQATPAQESKPKGEASKPSSTKADAPKPMPAAPGNEMNAPKVASSAGGPKMSPKPIDESKLLNKTGNSTTPSSATQPSAGKEQTGVTAQLNPTGEKPMASTKQTATPAQPTAKSEVSKTVTAQKNSPEPKKEMASKAAPTSTPMVAAQPNPTPTTTAKPMPNLINKPATTSTTPATSGSQMTEKPTAKGEKSEQPTEKTQDGMNTESSVQSNSPAPKAGDSAMTPSTRPSGSNPSTSPLEEVKPPKAQKSALPDPKVNKSPKMAESQPLMDPLAGKITTISKPVKANSGAAPTTTGTTDATQTGSTADASTSTEKSSDDMTGSKPPVLKPNSAESIRQKYLAGRVSNSESNTVNNSDVDVSAGDDKPESKIDKIRNKYKRGIKFVQDDEDEQAQTADNTASDDDEESASNRTVGPYNEFLPEREIVVYSTNGHPDPFMPLLEDVTNSSKGGPLPDVESLRLVGILQDRKSSRALFEDFNGYSYILKTGDRVKNGFVLAIEEARVMFQIRQYGWNRQVALDLDNEK